MKKEIVVSFPHLANYYVAINVLFEKGLRVKTIVPPPITKKTLELGSKHAPDFVCSPFKYNLGNFIEALEEGANVLVQSGGACRFGYYGELQEQILKDLNYDFDFICLSVNDKKEFLKIYKQLKEIGIKINFFRFVYYLFLCIKMVKCIDEFEDYVRKNIGFEVIENSFDKLHQEYLKELGNVDSFKMLKRTHKLFMLRIKDLEIRKPDNILKVGVVGELYTLMDSFSNHYIEKELGKKGVEITRYVTVDYLILQNAQNGKKLLKKKNKYVKHDLGAGGTDSVVKSLEFAQKEFDGIIHVKAFGCTPEVNAMPIMQRLANDFNMPILYFSFDTATSETGVKTRIEAFYDMLIMRRDVQDEKSLFRN